ncbi:MAG: insulinase family protein [Opitutae bacterium]|nr:insulinase family protein [Opitutae bacterium]
MIRLRVVMVLAVLLLRVGAQTASPWPVIDSDLPADPALRLGALPNGLRYAILPNAEPKDRVSLRFIVMAGSLHEEDDERGLAHFVEHQAFRHTRKFPDDSMVSTLQRRGISLGPDSGAFTFPHYTIYHIELPDPQAETLAAGLEVFREFADGVVFDKKYIEKERGVILSERAMHDTPMARAQIANMKFVWPNSRYVQRPVIGELATIKKFTRRQCAAFYEAWYRPERMAVVIVGAIDPAEVERQLLSCFGNLQGRGTARAEPAELFPRQASTPDIDGVLDDGLAGIGLTFEHPVWTPRQPDRQSSRVAFMRQQLAMSVLQRRLSKLAQQPSAAGVAPNASILSPMPEWRLAVVSISGKIDDWQTVAASIEQEHRRAIQHGFRERELAAAKANLLSSYEEAVRTAATRRSDWLAAVISGALIFGHVFTTPEAQRLDMVDAIAATTPDEVTEALRDLWSKRAAHVFLQANPLLHTKRTELARVLNDSRKVVMPPPEDTGAPAFAYQNFGPPGRLVDDQHVADLDVHLAGFANGVKLNFKSTQYEADMVYVYVRVGNGKLSQPQLQPGLDWLALSALPGGGLRRHTTEELAEVLAGRTAQLSFYIEPDACVFLVRCAKRDLLLGLQLVSAYLTDAAYRPSAMRDAQAWIGSQYVNMFSSPSGVIQMLALRMLLSGELRFVTPTYDETKVRTLDELSAWLEPQFRSGPIEMSVVGDIAWKEVTPAVAATLGALPRRKPRDDPDGIRRIHFYNRSEKTAIFPIDPKFKQCAIAWYWPVEDYVDTPQDRRCTLLAQILGDRLRVRLREKLGATYAPQASFVRTNGVQALNYFTLLAEVNTAQVLSATVLIREECAKLSREGVTEEEFARMKPAYVRFMNDHRASNRYWCCNALGTAQQYAATLVSVRNREADVEAITRADLDELARRHLDPTRGYLFITAPQSQGSRK